jgi:pimeloyl-[acyl-carrier protein] methyl ester esterase
MNDQMTTALVLLPGLDGTGIQFRPLLPHLPAEIRPIVLSYPPDKPLGYAELLPRVMSALPTDMPFVLLGESFSGPLSLMAAEARPRGLIGVILCATFIRNPAWVRVPRLQHLCRSFIFWPYRPCANIKAWICGYATPELTAMRQKAMAEIRPAVIAHRVRSAIEVNVTPQLISCPVPILYLRGQRDFIVVRRNLCDVQRALPSVKVVEFPCGHLVLQTQPKASADRIATFIAGMSSPETNLAKETTWNNSQA